jgi:hypothetical protein
MDMPKIIIEAVDDPVAAARVRTLSEQGKRNSDWLQAHWSELLPQARGKFVAVAEQEAFIADSVEDAWAWVARTHPGDNGALVQYVREMKCCCWRPGINIGSIRLDEKLLASA